MKRLFYFVLFVVLFIWFFLYTFPVSTVLGYYLNQYGIRYNSIKGNLLHVQIEQIQYKNLVIPKVNIKPDFAKIKINLDNEAYITLNLNKTIDIFMKNLHLENYQLKPQAYGLLKGHIKVFIQKKWIILDGNTNLSLKELKKFGLKNLDIHTKLKKETTFSKVSANIKSSIIKGRFDGKLIIPKNNLYATKLTGTFEGKLYGSNVKQTVDIKLMEYMR